MTGRHRWLIMTASFFGMATIALTSAPAVWITGPGVIYADTIIRRDSAKPDGGRSLSADDPIVATIRIKSGADSANRNPAVPLQEATISSGVQVLVNGMQYSVPLPQGTRLDYAITPAGIVWTPVAVDPAHAPQTEPVYLTSYTPLLRTGSHSVDLWASARLLANLPVGATNTGDYRSPITLYATHDFVLFSQTVTAHKGSQSVTFYESALDGQPTPVYHLTVADGTVLTPFATTTGAIFLQTTTSPWGKINVGTAYVNFNTDKTVAIPATVWPTRVFIDAHGTWTVTSGPIAFRIQPDGTLQSGYAPPDNQVLTALQALPQHTSSQWWYLPTSDVIPAWGTLLLNYVRKSNRIYQISVSSEQDATGAPTSDTTVTVTRTVTSSAHAHNGQTSTAAEQLVTGLYRFGASRILHQFGLNSSEGVVVQWSQVASTSGKAPKWLATFTGRHWRYEVGLFDDPAALASSAMVSAELKRSLAGTPTPLTDSGTVYIIMAQQPSGPQIAQTVIQFQPTGQLQVQLQGAGLSPFQQIKAWTLWDQSGT